MIYTPREIITAARARKRPKPRPAAENAPCDDLWKTAESGLKQAPIRHETACFGRRRQEVCEARKACFLGESRDAAPIHACALAAI
jgi:hypothetical protein